MIINTAQGRHVKHNRHLITLPVTHDWKVSTSLADRVFHGTKQWLLDCSSSEGSWGLFVWHGYPTGIALTTSNQSYYYKKNLPGGWMQFEPSTFNSYLHNMLAAMHDYGYTVDPVLLSFYEPLGQALVAGYMREYSIDRGQWSGNRC